MEIVVLGLMEPLRGSDTCNTVISAKVREGGLALVLKAAPEILSPAVA